MLTLEAARKLALQLPEAEERDHFGSPSFRVRDKIFAQLSAPDEAEKRALLKLPLPDQLALVMSDPEVFSPVPQWGQHGWTYISLNGIGAVAFRALLRQSWSTVAPKRLVSSCEFAND